jgi:hypothetical protein
MQTRCTFAIHPACSSAVLTFRALNQVGQLVCDAVLSFCLAKEEAL